MMQGSDRETAVYLHRLQKVCLFSQPSFSARTELCVLGEIHSRQPIQQWAFNQDLCCVSVHGDFLSHLHELPKVRVCMSIPHIFSQMCNSLNCAQGLSGEVLLDATQDI